MTRHQGALAAFLALAILAPAASRAAVITDVADAADGDDPLDVDFEFRWSRTQRKSKITRESLVADTDSPGNMKTTHVTELHHQRWTHTLDMGISIGLYHDLELHGNIPYAVHDEQYWNYATVRNPDTGLDEYVGPKSTIQNTNIDANGGCFSATDCTQTRPLMPVDGRVFRGGFLDPSIGFSWAIFNGEREQKLDDSWFPHKIRTATWVLGFDYTMPIIKAINPTEANPKSPDSSKPLPLGVGAHRFDFSMAMSKRVGIVEPFFRLHYTLPITSKAAAYDNCDARSLDADNQIMTTIGKQTCDPSRNDPAEKYWREERGTGLQAPHVGGVTLGTEFIPVEEKDGLRLSIGVSMSADYVSRGRYYTELSDALRKLTYAEQYFKANGQLLFDLRFSKWVHFVWTASLGTDTPHSITAEQVGKDLYGETSTAQPNGVVTPNSSEMNPNYDYRIDQPGRRFRVTNVGVYGVSGMLSVNF